MSKIVSGFNRVVIDWDGTCVESVYPDEGGWLEGAIDAIKAILASDVEVEILSTRIAPTEVDETALLPEGQVERELAYIRRMLDEAGLQVVGIWQKPWKPGAIAYIDDKGIRFDDWKQAMRDLEGLLPQKEMVI